MRSMLSLLRGLPNFTCLTELRRSETGILLAAGGLFQQV
jgi:hypothetical protein